MQTSFYGRVLFLHIYRACSHIFYYKNRSMGKKMSKKLKFIYNGLILTAVGFAMRAAGLFLSAYVSGAIGAAGVGLNSLITTAYAFAVTFATSGVSLSVTRLVAAAIGEGKAGEGSRILRGAMLYAALFGLAASILLFTLAGVVGKYILGDIRTAAALRILSLSLLPIALSGVISGYFVAVRRVTLNAAVQIIGQIMRIGLTVLLITGFSSHGVGYSVIAIAVGVTITEIVCFLVALVEFVFDRRIYRRTDQKGYSIAPVAKMAIPLAFSAYVRSFLLTVEHALIPKRLTDRGNTAAEALASYGYLHGMALPIILFPMTPLSSFSGLLVPEFAESEAEGSHRRMSYIASEALTKTLIYAIGAAVFIYSFSEEIGYSIYGSFDSGLYISVLAPVIPIMYLDHVTDSMLKGIGEHVYSMWVNIADSFLSVILVWLLIPAFDIFGYALVIIIMEVFNFAMSILRLKKRVKFKLSPIKSIVIPALSSFISAAVADRLFRFGGSAVTAFPMIMKMIFSVCLFLALNMLSNIILEPKSKQTLA